jgi:hypothetical protein
LIILSLWIPFAASGLPSGTAKVVSAGLNNQASQTGNLALLGTTIQQKALELLCRLSLNSLNINIVS